MIQIERGEKADAGALHVERPVSIEQALTARAGHHRTKAKVSLNLRLRDRCVLKVVAKGIFCHVIAKL